MTWRGQLEPRDPAAAATIAMVFICTASALGLAFTALTSTVDGVLAQILVYLVPPTVAAAALLLFRRRRRIPVMTWSLLPLFCLTITAIMDIGSRDASAGTQILFFLPILYAGSQLRPLAAHGTAVATAIAEAVVVFTLEDTARAITDASYVIGVLLAMTWLLVTAAERQERLVEQLRRQADVDPLTGLASRRVLTEAVHTALRVPSRGGTAFLLVDVDEFKTINDTHGHLVGDEALIHLGAILRARFPSGSVVCRLGGDEMAVLLLDCARADAVERAELLVETVLRSPLPGVGSTGLALSISVGVGQVPGGHVADASELYSLADASLYDAKRSGRGRVGRVPIPGTALPPPAPPRPRSPGDAGTEPLTAQGRREPEGG